MKRHFGLPSYFTTPPDVKKCKRYRTDGPTPCWHPHCDCFKPDWSKPELCLCMTLHERAKCSNMCDPVEEPTSYSFKALFWTFVFIALAAYLLCPAARGQTVSSPPLYCRLIMKLPRNCTSTRLIVRMWGKDKAEQRARACGATDSDIADGKSCLEKASP